MSLHAPQSKVSFSSLTLCGFVDAFAIVYNNNLERVLRKNDLHLDVFCVTMSEGVG